MIDLSDLRARPDAYKTAAKHKHINVDIDAFLALDAKRRALVPDVETMRKRQNEASKTMPGLKGAEKEALLQEMKILSSALKAKESELEAIEGDWQAQQFLLPQLPHSSVPVGKDETENVEASRWGNPDTWLGDSPPKAPRDHVALAEALDILDIARGVNIAGARSYVLKGAGALLHQAVLRFTIDHLVAKGWTLFQPPYLARYECFQGTGFFPGPDQANIYAVGGQTGRGGPIEPDDLHLIGTSEVSVCSYHAGETLPTDALPTRYAGYSPCFRREAGTYGKDTHGLYRIHQFEKVEQVVLCEADEGKAMAMFEEIRTNAEEVLRALKLPYRVLTICTGDMGKGKVFMQDIETWMPSRKSYGETHSCSYLGDFQARRLNITYKDADGKKRFVHTLNNTCIASPRILIPILEMYQNADGSITIPEVLRPYMGGRERIEKI
ncbi:MAG: seryl-tRNA synthetase [Candidatus Peregrinibacteria bacterium Gr01-1014_25]|nr:MAG: seryl-tRNA synthetase [Candidatus Peregrinibacteria bacterium Gr01-1014_25]